MMPNQSRSRVYARAAHAIAAILIAASLTKGAAAQSPMNQKGMDLAKAANAYIEAVGQKQFDRVAMFLDPNLEFSTPGGKDIHGAQDYVAALRHIAPILLRNDVKKTFVSGTEVCVIYDFVTDTQAGAVPSVEWISFKDGKIASVRLIFHSLPWPDVLKELKKRASDSSGAQEKRP